jgi:hypothetical protein
MTNSITLDDIKAALNQPKLKYGPMVNECKVRGIGRTKAFELAANGLIETFTVGRKRFVMIESLDTLPERLKQAA